MQASLIFFLANCLWASHGQWVDPHSMDTSAKSVIPERERSKIFPKHNSDHCKSTNNCPSDMHLRRIVRLILSNAYLDHEDVGYHSGFLNIKLSDRDHKMLEDFAQNIIGEDNIFLEISTIFEEALHKPILHRYKDVVFSTQDQLYYLIFNETSAALAGACLSLWIIYKLLQARFTWKSIINFFLIVMYVADFVITYLHIVHDEEVNNMVLIKQLGTVPPECDPKKLSWWGYAKLQFTTTLFENPCKTYYKATFQDFKYFIAPSLVWNRQFKTLVVEPFGYIGEAFGKFGSGLFTNLPWGLNVVLFPILLVVVLCTFFMVFLFITKPHFKFSLFHLITIELGGVQSARSNRPRVRGRNNQSRIQGRGGHDGQVGVAENDRLLIEDVSNNSSRDDMECELGANEESPKSQTNLNDGGHEEAVNNVGSDSPIQT